MAESGVLFRTRPARRRRAGFVEKTLAGVSHGIEQAIFTEENARRPGFLQRRDPRAKVAAFALLVLATGLSRDWPVLCALYALVLAGAAASRLALASFLKRTWLGIPLFSGVIIIPSIFLVGSHTAFSVPLGFVTLEATREGLRAAGIFVLRVGVSVSLAILLVMTTRWAEVLKSLRFFRVPSIFVLVLAMTYRYVFLFLHTLNGMLLARKSRMVARTPGAEQRWWIVSSLGVLMSRSFRMSEDVYQAMVARGFRGDFRSLTTFTMGPMDWLFVLASAAAAVAAVAAGQVLT